MTAGTSGILGVLTPVLELIGTFATFVLEHPKEKYHQEISSIKENRLNDVCNALGPIISDSYDFAKTNDDSAHEELEQNERATVAAANSITPPDDIPPLKDAIKKFNEPEHCYQRCRQAYFGSYGMFFLAIITGGLPAIIDWSEQAISNQDVIFTVAIWLSSIFAFSGILIISYS